MISLHIIFIFITVFGKTILLTCVYTYIHKIDSLTFHFNLLPEIQAHIALESISLISVLIFFRRRVEENLDRMHRFCPSPTNYKQQLEPE